MRGPDRDSGTAVAVRHGPSQRFRNNLFVTAPKTAADGARWTGAIIDAPAFAAPASSTAQRTAARRVAMTFTPAKVIPSAD